MQQFWVRIHVLYQRVCSPRLYAYKNNYINRSLVLNCIHNSIISMKFTQVISLAAVAVAAAVPNADADIVERGCFGTGCEERRLNCWVDGNGNVQSCHVTDPNCHPDAENVWTGLQNLCDNKG